ncbi:hypothetical protein K2X30_01840 [bacterium]|nr:hypothetical protein [bacterium]
MKKSDFTLIMWIGLAWLIVSAGAIAYWENLQSAPVLRVFLFWSLCMANLFALSQAGRAFLGLAGNSDVEKKSAHVLGIFGWGSLKLLLLAAIASVLWATRQSYTLATIAGISTLLVVPVAGGIALNMKEMKNA